MENPKSNLKALSASRIKTYESCSWLYWASYHLKLPQLQNDGARKGEVCHDVFELLLSSKHLNIFKTLKKEKSLSSVPALARLVKIRIKKVGLEDTAKAYTHIEKMILVGLETDFFVEGGTLIAPEYKFDLLNPSPIYYIKGFMDKPFSRGDEMIIDDFKSSKVKYEGEDKESNIQAMIYSLAAKKIWPDKRPTVRFIFLQFPQDPIMSIQFSDEMLKGFEEYLGYMQKKVDTFTEKEAKERYAYDKEVTGKEFAGKLMCGFAKSPHDKKKDGTKKWHCPYKFAFTYWILEREGRIVASAFKADGLDRKFKQGDVIKKMEYGGCPRFSRSNTLNNTSSFPIKDKQTKFRNVIDDLLKR